MTIIKSFLQNKTPSDLKGFSQSLSLILRRRFMIWLSGRLFSLLFFFCSLFLTWSLLCLNMPRPFFHKLIFSSTIQEKRLVTTLPLSSPPHPLSLLPNFGFSKFLILCEIEGFQSWNLVSCLRELSWFLFISSQSCKFFFFCFGCWRIELKFHFLSSCCIILFKWVFVEFKSEVFKTVSYGHCLGLVGN